ncbi:MAG TPA: hypothetical protein ENJ18_11995 [Nannocystis exedens]|nr:hypothetical protein [Nannocystis exedens]
MQTTHSSSFIRALVDDASTKPFLSSLLALKLQREEAERALQIPLVVEPNPIKRALQTQQAQQAA